MRCWYCGKLTMFPRDELGKGWFQCNECGATWVKMLKPGRRSITIESDPGTGGTKYKPRAIRRV